MSIGKPIHTDAQVELGRVALLNPHGRSGDRCWGIGVKASAFKAVERPQYQIHQPVVFHCAAGKDRTGLLAAILLGALGVSDDDIVGDYALTARHMDPIIERMRTTPGYAEIVGKLPAATFSSRPEAMTGTLAGVRALWGSMREYVAANGLRADELLRLEKAVLE